MRPVAPSSLTGPIGPHRRWSWAEARLSDVKAVRAALGGTVNDVVLTLITNGFRELLESRGEDVRRGSRGAHDGPGVGAPQGEHGVYNNRVSAVFAGLPVGLLDPVERLRAIRAEMDGIKESKQAVAGDVLSSMSGFAPPLLLALGSRLVTLSPRLNMHTATTNVPGPQQPVQTLGRRMLESYPFVPVVGSIRIVVAIFSYDGGAVLRRHRRLRRRSRHRRPDRRDRARHGRSARRSPPPQPPRLAARDAAAAPMQRARGHARHAPVAR